MHYALIGPGKVARHHYVPALHQLGAELVAVCGRNPDKTAQFAQDVGAAPYTDVAEMVRRERIDVAIVCTPHPQHRAVTVAALEAGAHVLVEKPLAATLPDADAMLVAAERSGQTLGVISQRRFYPPCQRIRQALDAGKFGLPALGVVQLLGWRDEAYYRSDPWRGSWAHEGGGVLINQAPHQLDLLLWYMGEVEEVYGLWRNVNHPYIEVEDTAVALIKFKNGGIGNLLLSNSQRPGLWGKVHIHGQNGASVGVQTDGGAMFIAGGPGIQEPPINDIWTIPGEAHDLPRYVADDTRFFAENNVAVHFFAEQIADFSDAIRSKRAPLVTAEDGRRVVELIAAIYESQRSGLPVKLPLS